MTLPTGTKLDPYEILLALGAGGMGEVYRAKDSRLGRDVAVKVLPSSFSADPDRLRRFEQEARAPGILNHPNITAVQDADSVVGWGSGERSIYVRRGSSTSLPARIVRIDLATAHEEKWRDLLPADAAGLNGIFGVKVTPDGTRYAYSYFRSLSNLYLAQGIR